MEIIKLIEKNLKILFRSKTSSLVIFIGPLLIILLAGIAFNNSSTYQINIGTCVSEFYIDPTSHVGTGGSGRLLDNGISTMDEDVANRTDTIRKIHTNRQVITGNQLIIYDDDDVTALFTFDLKDASDVATEDNPKKKVPV